MLTNLQCQKAKYWLPGTGGGGEIGGRGYQREQATFGSERYVSYLAVVLVSGVCTHVKASQIV